MGVDVIEWTFDPLQALNAHLNFSKLGVVVEEYEENVYGESSSPLHRGTPTDRFVAEWRLATPHVERRIAAAVAGEPTVRDPSAASAPLVNPSVPAGARLAPGSATLSLDDPCVLVEIPTGFDEMQQNEPSLALEWRLATRAIFESYLARGYRGVDFILSREARRGHYLLTRKNS
jgi:predicted GNAT superfamily acetyltransferase